jgi:hypothetical protein
MAVRGISDKPRSVFRNIDPRRSLVASAIWLIVALAPSSYHCDWQGFGTGIETPALSDKSLQYIAASRLAVENSWFFSLIPFFRKILLLTGKPAGAPEPHG